MATPRSTESLIYEARARIIWGEKADAVFEWLGENGVPEQLSRDIIRTSLKERALEIRKRGASEIIIGLAIAALGAGGIAGMNFVGVFSSRIGGLCGLAAVYGLYRLMRGIVWVIEGGKTHGSITDLGDGI